MNDFILGEEAYKTAKKSLSSLIKRSKEDKNERTAINLIINIKIQLVKTKDYKPRIIPITNKLDEPTNKSILLITKDPSNIYRDELTKKDCPTDDLFSDIYSFKKVKSMSKNKQNLIKFYKTYDLIVCDLRVQKFLPDVLGEIFYYKNKKVPFIIQMAKPNAKISTKSKENKIKDNRCDAKYVKLQVDSIVENTSYIPNSKGDCLNITIGYTDWKVNDLLVNLNDVVDYLINDKYLPIGGIVKSLNNLGNVHVKTSESISLPVYVKSDEDGKDNGDENDSDFDF
ncbi:UTP30 Ribosome biogenesis protein UTP30 [Candida maltosa Xu316]